jgi:hypothetical protein
MMQTVSVPDEPSHVAMRAYLEGLPVDDDALTPEEHEAYEQGLRDIANGDVITTDELHRLLGQDEVLAVANS